MPCGGHPQGSHRPAPPIMGDSRFAVGPSAGRSLIRKAAAFSIPRTLVVDESEGAKGSCIVLAVAEVLP